MITDIPDDARRPPGRPREFDLDRVLDDAIEVFSRNGYGATSITVLSAATGLSQGSIYKAFGGKRAMLEAALDHYLARRAGVLNPRLAAAGSGRERIEVILRYYAEMSAGEAGRRGCLVVAGLTELSCSDPALEHRVTALFADHEHGFAEAVRQGQADGSVSSDIDAAAAARLLLCVVQGMRVIGKTGWSRAGMQAVVADAMALLCRAPPGRKPVVPGHGGYPR